MLRWTPDQFWRATVFEYTAAMKGHLLSKGVKVGQVVSRDEFLDMVDEVKQTKAR